MALSGLLYRLGGIGKPYNTKFRDLGIPTINLLVALFIFPVSCHWWAHVLVFGCMFGALTTYWDFIFKEDNFYAHGFMIGLSSIWYVFFTHHWDAFAIHCLGLALFMGLWSDLIGKDTIEEFGRGAIIPPSNFFL